MSEDLPAWKLMTRHIEKMLAELGVALEDVPSVLEEVVKECGDKKASELPGCIVEVASKWLAKKREG